ncbi:MAG TPA: SGNH/GDSL hydrolase family protein [Bryobacteraceae bacterium]|jgi:lysophospholipase L1-like esterase|nr:SGNH/GDSL hydrolase family protein [Bryobacteraceae bacterium]
MRITALLFLTIAITPPSFAAEHTRWVGTWEASPSQQLPDEAKMQTAKLEFKNQTLREIVHTSIGGDTLRVRLSNAYGKDTVEIGGVHIALHSHGADIVAGSDHALTFGGQASISIPPNAPVLSDPVKLNIPAAGDLVISIFLPQEAAGAGIHYAAQQTAYIAEGDVTGASSIPDATKITSWVFLTGVDVLAPETAGAIVAFGDSITDGAHSSVDANARWPNILADRLLHGGSKKNKLAVLDAGIGGNRVLHDAATNIEFGVNSLARFNRDVIAQSGVKYVIVLEGINDLGHAGSSAPTSQTVSAEEIEQGLIQMIARAHEKGLKIFGATLTPFEGTVYRGYFTPEKEVKRKAINQWIRSSNAFDGVIDFDKAVLDPSHPDRMLPADDSGDHLHPNDAGYKAMADSIPLSLFK